MAMLFVLVLSGAAVWGVTNVMKKHLLKDVDVNLMVVATMLGASIFTIPAQFAILGTPNLQSGLWTPLMWTILFNIGIQYLGVVALKLEDAALVAALQGITPLFLIFTSWVMLGEFPTTFGLFGITITVLGTYILNIQGAKTRQGRLRRAAAPWVRLFSSKGAVIALFTALLGSIALNFDKVVVLNSSPFMRAGLVFLPIAIVTYIVAMVTGRWQKINKKAFWPLFGIGLLIGLSNVLMDSGFLFGIVPYVGSLKRFNIVVTAVLAAIFLHEKYMPSRIAGAVTIVIGIILLYF